MNEIAALQLYIGRDNSESERQKKSANAMHRPDAEWDKVRRR